MNTNTSLVLFVVLASTMMTTAISFFITDTTITRKSVAETSVLVAGHTTSTPRKILGYSETLDIKPILLKEEGHTVTPSAEPAFQKESADIKTASLSLATAAENYSARSWHYSALKSIPKVRKKYGEMIKKIADRRSLSPEFLTTIIVVESLGDPNAVSHTGAIGLTQLTTIAVQDVNMSGNLYNPKTNLKIGAAYLAKLRDNYGYQSKSAIAVAYNAGPGATRSMSKREITNHDYAQKVAFVLKHL